jgi:hypothetical protein
MRLLGVQKPFPPVITARLTQDLLAFNFIGQSADDNKSILHPFMITDGNSKRHQTNTKEAQLYSLLTDKDVSCSLADVEALSAKEIRSVPLSY